jgi:glycosyltransferase involved in cell wall biosynthesis
MKKKVLLIPTYFPTQSSEIVGAQIKEQARIMAEDFDIVVIHCLPGDGWKRFLWQRLLSLLTGRRKYRKCDQKLASGDLNAVGVYYFTSRLTTWKSNIRRQKAAYQFVVEDMATRGWVPELIHARGFDPSGIIANYLGKKLAVPYILTENTAFIFDEVFTVDKVKYYRQAFNESAYITFVSSFLMRLTLMHDVGKRVPTMIVGNPVDAVEFVCRARNPRPIFTVVAVGYNSYIKDFDTLFRAIRLLLDRGHDDLRLIVAVTYSWSEENKAGLPALAKSVGIENYCEFLYEVPRAEMPDLYARGDVFVCSSIVETFGIACLEAIFCGLPVISTENGGTDDFIGADNGIKIPIKNPISMASAIESVKTGLVTFDVETIRSSVMSKFGKDAFRRAMKTVYDTAIRSK